MKNIETIRHSLAHVMAATIQELYPAAEKGEPRQGRGTKFGIGPAIENGFYYDFDFVEVVNPKSETPKETLRDPTGQVRNPKQIPNSKFQIPKLEDLPRIEKKMRELIKNNIDFKKKVVSNKEAKNIFKNQQYKLELINELKEGRITIYESGNFVDLCAGPHVKSTKEIPADAFRLTKIAGAYWLGDEKNKMLTRIYGVAFATKKELDNYLLQQKEAEKRDHRILGQKLDLFLIDEEVGAGLPLWTPKGTMLRKIIENYLYEELSSENYLWVTTPHIGKLSLWKTSGHWELYRENMYSPIEIENEQYELKPMNCPFHVKIYQSKIRSYKNLPLKYAELGTVYRFERSGTLHGLTRVRGFTQDDAHLWCTPDQLTNEVIRLVKHGLKVLKDFGFREYTIYLSTKPEKYAGTPKDWEKATNVLKYVLAKLKLKYQIDPGGGVFYGPKIDIKIKDNLGREWQCTTIQVDFNLPERFNIAYINQKGEKERPYMIHRALLGSMERFVGVLIEHYAGALPLWLTPEQIWVIPVGTHHEKYAKSITQSLKEIGLRARTKDENKTVSKKIREGEIQKIPYLLVVGDKEMKSKSVRVRKRGKGDIGKASLTKFKKSVIMEITEKQG